MVSPGMRKVIVIALVGLILLTGKIFWIACWLQDQGVIAWAVRFRQEYLNSSVLTVIVILLVLLAGPRPDGGLSTYRCPVCDRKLSRRSPYCPECGSRL